MSGAPLGRVTTSRGIVYTPGVDTGASTGHAEGIHGRPSESYVRAQIAVLIERVVTTMDPVRVVIFGSFARGDYTAMSDLDLCVILAQAEDWFERQRRFRRLVDLPGIEVEPHIYTVAEYAKMLEQGNPLALRIRSEGKVLYEQQ
jgi:predicted nucleotidyltransferase